MAYKYQNEIEDAVDVMVKVMGEEKHGKAQQELAEVYRKAEAFDEVIEASENIDNHIDFTEAIDEIVIRHKGGHL